MRTRFAPSPNGYLHAGHAFSALSAYQGARAAGGEMLLRIEDVDHTRARPAFVDAIFEDLAWLGLIWPQPVRKQSDHLTAYRAALDKLHAMGLLYPCTCTRKDMAGAAIGPDGPVYPGTCRAGAQRRDAAPALRLNLDLAVETLNGQMLRYDENGALVIADIAAFGDPILGRRDIGLSYHIAHVVDDAAQGITHVIRGKDIQPQTPLHVLLQALLGLRAPIYHHHDLIMESAHQKLSKSKGAPSLRDMQADGVSAAQLRADLGFADLVL